MTDLNCLGWCWKPKLEPIKVWNQEAQGQLEVLMYTLKSDCLTNASKTIGRLILPVLVRLVCDLGRYAVYFPFYFYYCTILSAGDTVLIQSHVPLPSGLLDLQIRFSKFINDQ